jgi:glycosyltransferase involved in cell wall biosynthesis
MPKVSVIIPTYNRPHLLPRAVESVFKSATNVEVIVVDDASIDETANVCKSLPGITYIRSARNQRTAGARNLGILKSTAEYISFLDDDDMRLPGTLDLQIEILENNPDIGFVYGPVYQGDDDCQPIPNSANDSFLPEGDIFWETLSRSFIPCQSVVFRKSCLFTVGLMDKDLYGIDDLDLWIRLAEIYPARAVKTPVAIWRKASSDSGQGSSDILPLYEKANKIHETKWMNLPRAKNESKAKRKQLKEAFRHATASHLTWSVSESLQERQYLKALRHIGAILEYNPKQVIHPKNLSFWWKSLWSKGNI